MSLVFLTRNKRAFITKNTISITYRTKWVISKQFLHSKRPPERTYYLVCYS